MRTSTTLPVLFSLFASTALAQEAESPTQVQSKSAFAFGQAEDAPAILDSRLGKDSLAPAAATTKRPASASSKSIQTSGIQFSSSPTTVGLAVALGATLGTMTGLGSGLLAWTAVVTVFELTLGWNGNRGLDGNVFSLLFVGAAGTSIGSFILMPSIGAGIGLAMARLESTGVQRSFVGTAATAGAFAGLLGGMIGGGLAGAAIGDGRSEYAALGYGVIGGLLGGACGAVLGAATTSGALALVLSE